MAAADFKGKKALVLGLGIVGGGAGTVKFLSAKGAEVTVTDLRPEKVLKPALKNFKKFKKVRRVFGRHREKDVLAADFIVKNPAVRPDSPYLILAEKAGVPVTSEVGIFFKNSPSKNIIGVTGTRGKSTAAYLIYKFLRKKFKKVFLAGNIGKSALEILPKVSRNAIVVLELSSFQLYSLGEEKISPKFAVLTNIFPDHLNWHKNFREYLEAKKNIFRFQKSSNLLFIDAAQKNVTRAAKNAPAKIVRAKLPLWMAEIVDKKLGGHYRTAVSLAAAAAGHFKVGNAEIKSVLENFRGLPGRQEILGKIGGVCFVNDSASTVPEAGIAALRRFREMAGKKNSVILIAGGEDKNLDFREFCRAVSMYARFAFFLPGGATVKMKRGLEKNKKGKVKIFSVKTLKEAVGAAYRLAVPGDYVVFSPAATSFGLFLNEFERGKSFKDEARKLKMRHGRLSR